MEGGSEFDYSFVSLDNYFQFILFFNSQMNKVYHGYLLYAINFLPDFVRNRQFKILLFRDT